MLRHFCMETFADPVEWFSRRRVYTRSTAANSMVGYIMGLGDRHCQNILLDTQTAESIQIDLGLAFDQGKVLGIPERVPFRLTREIIDGMGVTGVEGIYRRSCEEVLQVLRGRGDAILTILEVLKHDPMYHWDTSSRSNQGMTTGAVASSSSSPSNMLLRVKEKLSGVEGGSVLNVTGQVNELVNQASDPLNLCRMYKGWRPWL